MKRSIEIVGKDVELEIEKVTAINAAPDRAPTVFAIERMPSGKHRVTYNKQLFGEDLTAVEGLIMRVLRED